MGCLQSKKEPTDVHPNVFRVVNIDENGADLWSGQLEITESDIILYREGRDCTVWPLHSLRRYGFEADIFSFESGRRCETGEGIYAFRCRRAAFLFRTLQQHIQLRNIIHDSIPYPVPTLTAGTPSPQARQTLQASVVHRSSIDNGPGNIPHVAPIVNNNLPNLIPVTGTLRNINHSPSSPGVDVLEVMPLYPGPQSINNLITNVYQRDHIREHNNNQAEISDPRHVYCNDMTRDLATLRNSLHQDSIFNTVRDIEDENKFMESLAMKDKLKFKKSLSPISPTLSITSDQFAHLSGEQQEAARLYMNIGQTEASALEMNKHDTGPPTPLTPKQVEYCNLSVGLKPELNTYANLSIGDMPEAVKNAKLTLNLDHTQKFSESDTYTSMSPVEELEVNYAVLDIDSSKDVASRGSRDLTSPESQSYNSSKNESSASCSLQSRARLVSQGSLEPPPIAPPATVGYTTIDFDKTVALTSVAAGTELDQETGTRKTRHNSCNVIFGSPNSDKPKGIN